jgi:hypothetical protein
MRSYGVRGGVGFLALAAALAWPGPARAQSDQDKGLATALFDDAKVLLAAGKVGEACRKLEESRRLDPLPGTVLNLASCHEREGLTASAMAEFREARAMAERDHRADRVAFADEHMRALEPRLAMLLIVVSPEADRPDLTVKSDGVALARAAWGTRIPVNPGIHVVEAMAPGKVRRRIELTVKGDGDVETATVAPLEDEPVPPPSPVVVAPPPPMAAAPPPPAPPPGVPPPRTGLSSRRIVALASGSAGVVGVGLGTYFGLTAIKKHNDPNAACPSSGADCNGPIDLNNQAKFNADASTVSFAIGLAALAAGAYLWLGDTSVTVSTGVGRLAVSGAF